MVETLLRVPTTYFDKVVEAARSHPSWDLNSAVSRVGRDVDMPTVSELYNQDRRAEFYKQALTRRAGSAAKWAYTTFPLWKPSPRALNLHLAYRSEGVRAVYPLNVATALANYLQSIAREQDRDGFVDIEDVVVGSGSFRFLFRNLSADVAAQVVGAIVIGAGTYLFTGGSAGAEESSKTLKHRIELERTCADFAQAAGRSVLACYDDYGRVSRITGQEVQRLKKEPPSDQLSADVEFSVAFFTGVDAGTLIKMKSHPFMLIEDARDARLPLVSGQAYDISGFVRGDGKFRLLSARPTHSSPT